MSLEQAILEHAAAMRELAAAMRGADVAPVAKAEKPAKAEKQAEKQVEKQVEKPAAPVQEGPTLEEVSKRATLLVSKKGRDVALEVLAAHGLSKFTEAKTPDVLAALYASINDKLAEE